MGELEADDGGQTLFGRKNVHKTFADDDSVAVSHGFKRSSQQHAAVNGSRKLELVADDEIICNRLEHMIEIARVGQKTSLRQAIENILLRLVRPLPSGLQGTHILRVVAGIYGIFNENRFVLRSRVGQFQRISPEVSLTAKIEILDINGYGQPDVRLHVRPPTVEMEIQRSLTSATEGASKTDDEPILILNPHAADESAHSRMRLRPHVKNHCTDIA